jgi:tripartite-type tricarboxylate transporter receptor subunit TctC
MRAQRRDILKAVISSAFLGTGGSTLAQSSLTNARIIVGFPPGGTPDVVSRRLSEKMTPSYASTMIVDNRTGAGGQIAVSAMKGAPTDGSVILICAMAILGVYPHTYKKLPYDPIADLTPVTVGVTTEFAFAVGPAVPDSIKTIPQFMEWTKSNKDKAAFGSPAPGSPLHFTGVLLGRAAGVELTHVGYRGSQAAIQDMLGGQLPALVCPIGECLRHLPTGKLRVLGTSGEKKSRFIPGVATFAEQGFKELVFNEWYGFFLPANSAPSVVQRLNVSLTQALRSSDVVEFLNGFGLEAAPGTAAELALKLKQATEQWGRIAKEIGFTVDS